MDSVEERLTRRYNELLTDYKDERKWRKRWMWTCYVSIVLFALLHWKVI